MIKIIIFDFDETLADTKELNLRIIRKHIGNLGYEISKKLLI